MALERETETYNAKLSELMQHEGRFVVIQGEEVAGTWETYEDALKAGYEKYGPTSFMVKKVQAIEPVQYFTRGIPKCRS